MSLKRLEHFQTTKDIWAHFTNYLFVLWRHLGLPNPTPIQYEMAEWLQYGEDRSLLIAFRGAAKSWIAGAKVTYDLGRNPEYHKYMVISAGEDKALEQASFIKRIIETFPLLKHIKPTPGNGNNIRWSLNAFDVVGAGIHQAPSVRTKGITGQLTGGRPTDILFDDVEVPKNSETIDMRAKLLKATEEFEALLVPGGTAKGLGTPQTEESVYRPMITERGYKVLYVPVLTPTKDAIDDVYGGRTNLSKEVLRILDASDGTPGIPTDPLRFNADTIAQKAAGMTGAGFRLHFMLDTTLSDADKYPLKLKDLIITEVSHSSAPLDIQWGRSNPIEDIPSIGLRGDKMYRPIFVTKDAWTPYTSKVMTIDPAGLGKDEVGWCCSGELKGRVFIMGYGGLSGGYSDENMKFLVDKAISCDINTILVEDNFGDGMFSKLLQLHIDKARIDLGGNLRLGVQGFKTVATMGHKHKRIIETLEPFVRAHRLIIDIEAIREDCMRARKLKASEAWYSGMLQYTRITNVRNSIPHDDQIEAIQMAVEYYKDILANSTKDNVREYQDKLFDEDIKKFFSSVDDPINSGTRGRSVYKSSAISGILKRKY